MAPKETAILVFPSRIPLRGLGGGKASGLGLIPPHRVQFKVMPRLVRRSVTPLDRRASSFPRAGTERKTERRVKRSTKTETTPALARPWNVIVWDDPINLMNYVTYVLQKLFGFSTEKATTKMLEVHEQGRSVVATEERERAEFHVTRLHAYGLQATMERVEA